MAVQHDDIDVKHLVQIGLCATFVSMAVAYLAAGLNYRYDAELEAERQAARLVSPEDPDYIEPTPAPTGETMDSAREETLKRYR